MWVSDLDFRVGLLKTDRLMVESDCATAVAAANNTSTNYSGHCSVYKNISTAKWLLPIFYVPSVNKENMKTLHPF